MNNHLTNLVIPLIGYTTWIVLIGKRITAMLTEIDRWSMQIEEGCEDNNGDSDADGQQIRNCGICQRTQRGQQTHHIRNCGA